MTVCLFCCQYVQSVPQSLFVTKLFVDQIVQHRNRMYLHALFT